MQEKRVFVEQTESADGAEQKPVSGAPVAQRREKVICCGGSEGDFNKIGAEFCFGRVVVEEKKEEQCRGRGGIFVKEQFCEPEDLPRAEHQAALGGEIHAPVRVTGERGEEPAEPAGKRRVLGMSERPLRSPCDCFENIESENILQQRTLQRPRECGGCHEDQQGERGTFPECGEKAVFFVVHRHSIPRNFFARSRNEAYFG